MLTLRPDPLAEASRWIDGHRRLWERKLDVIEAYLEESR